MSREEGKDGGKGGFVGVLVEETGGEGGELERDRGETGPKRRKRDDGGQVDALNALTSLLPIIAFWALDTEFTMIWPCACCVPRETDTDQERYDKYRQRIHWCVGCGLVELGIVLFYYDPQGGLCDRRFSFICEPEGGVASLKREEFLRTGGLTLRGLEHRPICRHHLHREDAGQLLRGGYCHVSFTPLYTYSKLIRVQ